MREVSSIDVNFVKMRVALSEKSKFENASIKREERPLGGGVVIRALGTLAPHLSWSIVINGYIPSRLSARHWARRVHIRCFWRTESKRWNEAVGELLRHFKIGWVAIFALTQTISDLLWHQLQENSCSCQLHLSLQTCRDKVMGVWGLLRIRWGIERGAHRPRMKEILRQHHHARSRSRISALALFVCLGPPRSLGT